MKVTPMLRQYLDLKAQAGEALLLYRMGDFYELFFEDAQKAAPVLGITLTRRRHNEDVEAPMCGVPHHAFDGYIGRLLEAGFRVAVAEQVEDPAKAKGLVRREIIRVHTPGTVSETDLLEAGERCYLAAVGGDPEAPAVAWLELSSGVFEGMQCADAVTLTEQLARLRPRELLVAEGWNGWAELWPAELPQPTTTPLPAEAFSPTRGEVRLKRTLGVATLRGFGLRPGEALVGLAGAVLGYIESTHRADAGHLTRFARRYADDALVVDRASLRNLEVERSAEGSRRGSLVATLDHCSTRMGSRLLADWLVRPSVDLETITDRHRAVGEMVDDPEMLRALRGVLETVPDLERLAGRVGLAAASPRDLESLRAGIDALPAVVAALGGAASPLLRRLADGLDPLADLGEILHGRLAAEPAAAVGAGVLAGGFDAELDEQRRLARGGKELLAGIERSERERTGISSLKVRYNKVFGYYIEVSRSNLERVPPEYERRQTLTNAERFVTPELKELEAKILSAEERATIRERELYQELLAELGGSAARIGASAANVARLDALAAFADRARRRDYCRPVMEDSGRLVIRDGRHPVLEEVRREDPFVPNDCAMDPDEQQIVLLTGPNMGGKSTYLRQVALIVLMAQAGSFVPAAEATVGVVDRIFTRVGASDMLSRGESTFMVEMTEAANILNHATPRSLVVLDEVGRGTATFDGLSLAWAIVEHLHETPERAAKVLFATHYHELTDLARVLPRLVNRSMGVREWQGSIVFLHRVVDGPADRSYGIHVARLAGVPDVVCGRAEDVLANLERHELSLTGDLATHGGVPARPVQMPLFRAPSSQIATRLRELDLDRTTPMDALALLARLKELASRED